MNKVLIAVFLVNILVVGLVFSDIQPIDVEPVIKKEQPDFEDDTGLGVLAQDATGIREIHEANDLVTKFSIGTNLSFTNAFVASFSVIIVSELGDKTFFIAAIMAMSHPRVTIFSGAMIALAMMHILSVFFGYVITYVPRIYTFYVSTALFAFFGLKMLREGCKMSPDVAQEELEEVQMDLRRRDETQERDTPPNVEEGLTALPTSHRNETKSICRSLLLKLFSRIFIQAFTLTFLAEWGDRSQIATVILAARQDVYGVIVGGLLGHFLCTGLAVIGGRMIASKISIRTVTMVGGVVFLLFAVAAIIMGP